MQCCIVLMYVPVKFIFRIKSNVIGAWSQPRDYARTSAAAASQAAAAAAAFPEATGPLNVCLALDAPMTGGLIQWGRSTATATGIFDGINGTAAQPSM